MKPLPRIDDFNPKTISIVQLVERTGVSLTRAGSNYIGLCPFHPDKETPSLVIYPGTNSWCCFGTGCGGKSGLNGGDVIEWVKQKLNVKYPEAIRWLEENFKYLPPHPVSKSQLNIKSEPINNGIIEYWHSMLKEHRSYFNGRGFKNAFIDKEMFGWDGKRYTIPVWEGEPGNSDCVGIRRRRANSNQGPKYIGLKGSNLPTVWGRWHCRGRKLIVAFAGELDAARAVQDGIPAFSLVNGANASKRFPSDWPNLWFPDAEYCASILDRKEEAQAGHIAEIWCNSKGMAELMGRGRVINWPEWFEGKDYCDFRDLGHSPKQFMDIVISQLDIT